MIRAIRSDAPEQNDLPALYTMLVGTLQDRAVFTMDPAGVIASWNPGVERLLGFKESEWIGRSSRIIFTPEDIAKGEFDSELRRSAERGCAADVRWHLRKDGSPIFVDGLLQSLRSDDGELLGFAKVVKDATGRKRAEEEQDRFFQLCVEMLAVAGFDGRFRRVSRNWTNVLGWSEGELIGRPWLNFVHPEDVEATVAETERVLQGHDVVSFQNRLRTSSGEYRWISWKGSSNPEQQLIYAAGTDITDSRKAEFEREKMLEERAHRAAELDAILRSMPDAVYVGDENGIRECNQVALDILGFKGSDELRHSVPALAERIQTRSVRTGRLMDFEEQPFVRALRGERCVEEVSTTSVDTVEEVIVRCAAAPVRQNGRVVGAVAINTDITRQKRIEAEREQLLAALQHSNQELLQFSHVVSHDLQAPLRMITSYTKLLANRYQGRLDETADEYIATILDGGKAMESLIRGLLQYAQSGDEAGERRPVCLKSLINDVLAKLELEIRETDAEILYGDLPTVVADQLQLSQLFQNLIGNALKYRHPGRTPQVRISADRHESQCVLAVEDNGLGIEPRHQERIFAPLKRLHGAEIPGTGIGLAVCRKIVERHGGRIWVESELGKGAKFCFTLPL